MIVVNLLLLILLHLAVLGGLAAVVLGLSGNFILLGLALLTAWIGGFEYLSLTALLVFLLLAVLGEVIEAILGVVTARKFGASRWGMAGAFFGGLVGAALGTLWIPLLGSLVGAILGAFAGAFLAEWLGGRDPHGSARAGTGALLGRAAATVLKLGIGIAIGLGTLRAAYPLV